MRITLCSLCCASLQQQAQDVMAALVVKDALILGKGKLYWAPDMLLNDICQHLRGLMKMRHAGLQDCCRTSCRQLQAAVASVWYHFCSIRGITPVVVARGVCL